MNANGIKAANMLTRTAALEAAEHGIRINKVAPGPIETPILSEFIVHAQAAGSGLSEATSPPPPAQADRHGRRRRRRHPLSLLRARSLRLASCGSNAIWDLRRLAADRPDLRAGADFQ
jgi:NAD(P)-dependent dehydrogenase (short-subunit alcohol dehydrogenase family)